ncbi:MAG TPA: CsgG/HfaB family protein [Gemmatimonadaceae bacterium]|nr:CsgG/HfaB family protein [Gemmatimonadaceae bacterium]
MIASRSFVRLTFAMLAALPMTAQSAASQDTRPTVAVLYFDNNSIGRDAADYAGMGKGVADLLITDLSAAANVRVVERERIEALLQEQNLAKQGQIDPATAVRLGRILGARHMISGGFMSTGDRMVLTARAFDVETGQIVNTQKVSQAGDDVLALIGELSTRLTTSLQLPPMERRTGDAGHDAGHESGHAAQHPAPHAAHHAPAKLDLRTALLYSKALEAQDAGDRAKAVELYNQVLDRFPNLESARANRDKLQASND